MVESITFFAGFIKFKSFLFANIRDLNCNFLSGFHFFNFCQTLFSAESSCGAFCCFFLSQSRDDHGNKEKCTLRLGDLSVYSICYLSSRNILSIFTSVPVKTSYFLLLFLFVCITRCLYKIPN